MGVGAGWYYDSQDGDVVHQNLAESLANSVFSYYHGPYATSALAVAHKGVTGAPAKVNESLGQQAENVAGTGLGLFNGKAGAADVTRVAQILLGAILIAVAAARISGAENIVSKVIR
ncbi:MAG TPA: hypothetical protein VGG25_31310 [Streptosporangiaceae bacterium]|jgi:hypothetical protein